MADKSKPRARRSILVVEDNEFNREMLCEILKDDFDVVQAENGLVGLEQLELHYKELSLVLLDVYMPECDGFEFLRRKQREERYDSVPVIVTTASGLLQDEITCLKLGANDFVVKPYNVEIMMNRINNTIHLRESASIVNQLTWDNLTSLYSKEFFYRNVEDAFAAFPDVEYDMVCSDIANFKTLNERYGEKNCDQLLSGLAARLEEALPDVVVGGRIGGDTFAFLIKHQKRGWEDRLFALSEGLWIINPSIKYGIVENVDRTIAVSQTCDRGLFALDGIKKALGVGIAWYDDDLRHQQMNNQIILESVDAALENRQFVIVYQPKHDVKTSKTVGAEALVRWAHPELGYISPNAFIPLFERNGFITKLDLYVWEEACRELRRCVDLGLPVVPISVNSSGIDFDTLDLADSIIGIIDAYGIDHSLLHIELTETAYADNPAVVARTLATLREQGLQVELDDFGSGYSSLALLNTLPLDAMKLDMSLIRQAMALDDFRIIESMIKLANILDLKTVVEGVESYEAVCKLEELGSDMIQGFYYSKPLGSDEFESYLQQEPRTKRTRLSRTNGGTYDARRAVRTDWRQLRRGPEQIANGKDHRQVHREIPR